jgi:hypothetical protein
LKHTLRVGGDVGLGELWRAESNRFPNEEDDGSKRKGGAVEKLYPPITYELAHIFVLLSLFSPSLFFWYEMERSLRSK